MADFQVPTAGGAGIRGTITLGPDNNLWFAELAASKIGRITPSGSIVEFPLAKNSSPMGIVAGPDGQVWFTESDSNKLGSIAP